MNITPIPISCITDKDHGFEGSSFEDEFNSYRYLIRNMTLRNTCSPILLYGSVSPYYIADGWHRWQIALLLNWKTIPALIVKDLDDVRQVWGEFKKLGYIVE